MRSAMFSTLTPLALAGCLVLLTGCDEYHPTDEAQRSTQPPPASPGLEGRQSTLGKAKDAGERTRDRMQDYHERVLEEADNMNQP